MSIYATCHGNIGKDAASRSVGQHTVIEFSVACTHGFGEKAVTTWIRVQGWGQYWSTIADKLKKGKEVIVQGEVYEREYQGKSGPQKSLECKATSCRFLGSKKEPAAPSDDAGDVPF